MKMEFDERICKLIRSRSKKERFMSFEMALKYFFEDINRLNVEDKDKYEDMFLLDEVKQSIIIFMSKDMFNETNEILLNRAKRDFYEGLTKLKERYSEIPITTIVLFMEDYYFNDDKREN